jgi:hypothetical protein
MRKLRIATAGLLLAFGAAFLAQQGLQATAQEKAKAYNLVLTVVKVKATNADGKAWDPNDGRPDIVVRIKNLSDTSIKEFVSEERQDTFEARYDRATMLVTAGQRIQIEVVDKDAVGDDTVGRTTLELPKDLLSKGGADIGFGQVESLKLEFRNP